MTEARRPPFAAAAPAESTAPDTPVAARSVARGDWEALYTQYGRQVAWGHDQPEELLLAMLERHALPADGAGRPVLDIGCGNGRNSLMMADRGLRVIGLDFSRAALAQFRERAAALPLVHANAVALPFASQVFAAAVDNGCLHAIDPTDHAAYAAGVVRVLRRGGLFFLSARARPSSHPAAEPIFLIDGVPEWGFTRDELEAMFAPSLVPLEARLREGSGSERFHHLVLKAV